MLFPIQNLEKYYRILQKCVGGDVKPLVKTAKSGRDIIAIDGCPLACCKNCLGRHEVAAKHHVVLSDYDVLKVKGEDPNPDLFEKVYEQISEQIFSISTGK